MKNVCEGLRSISKSFAQDLFPESLYYIYQLILASEIQDSLLNRKKENF
jgi:hypothetical protein